MLLNIASGTEANTNGLGEAGTRGLSQLEDKTFSLPISVCDVCDVEGPPITRRELDGSPHAKV